jgi:chlorobactene lauroyltransferase
VRPFRPAGKSRPGEWLVTNLLVRPAVARAFGGVYVHADPAALALRARPDLPAVFCATHTGWWDGYMAALINRRVFKRDAYLMMEDASLARYPFFTWVGVFGVDRDDPRRALASIEYASGLLTSRPGRAVWLFPQGTITHPDTRPLRLYGGAAHLARRAGRCALVPVALRYEFRLEQAPDAFVRVGPPLVLDLGHAPPSSRELTARLDAAISLTDDLLHAGLLAGTLQSYRRILSGRGSANKIWDRVLNLLGRD